MPAKPKFTKELKNDFLEAYVNNNFNIRIACEKVGISKFTYYRALTWDDDFRKKIELNRSVAKVLFQSSIMEGISVEDLTLRKDYLKLLPAGTISKILNFEVVNDNTFLFELKKDDFIK